MLGYKNETFATITFNVEGPRLIDWATKSQMIPNWFVWAKKFLFFLDRYMKIPKEQLFQSFEIYLHEISFNNRVLLINSKDIVSSH